jgi:hypothetical protein
MPVSSLCQVPPHSVPSPSAISYHPPCVLPTDSIRAALHVPASRASLRRHRHASVLLGSSSKNNQSSRARAFGPSSLITCVLRLSPLFAHGLYPSQQPSMRLVRLIVIPSKYPPTPTSQPPAHGLHPSRLLVTCDAISPLSTPDPVLGAVASHSSTPVASSLLEACGPGTRMKAFLPISTLAASVCPVNGPRLRTPGWKMRLELRSRVSRAGPVGTAASAAVWLKRRASWPAECAFDAYALAHRRFVPTNAAQSSRTSPLASKASNPATLLLELYFTGKRSPRACLCVEHEHHLAPTAACCARPRARSLRARGSHGKRSRAGNLPADRLCGHQHQSCRLSGPHAVRTQAQVRRRPAYGELAVGARQRHATRAARRRGRSPLQGSQSGGTRRRIWLGRAADLSAGASSCLIADGRRCCEHARRQAALCFAAANKARRRDPEGCWRRKQQLSLGGKTLPTSRRCTPFQTRVVFADCCFGAAGLSTGPQPSFEAPARRASPPNLTTEDRQTGGWRGVQSQRGHVRRPSAAGCCWCASAICLVGGAVCMC